MLPLLLPNLLSKHTVTFDRLGFVKYMKDIGRAYRTQALALISLCRFLVQMHEPSLESFARLRNVLQFVDDALTSAAELKTKTSEEADKRFEKAIHMLFAFKDDFPQNDTVSDQKWEEIVTRTMANDRSRGLVDALKENLYPKRTGNELQEPTRVVVFLILSSLLDKFPIVVRQALGASPTLQEILWNFSRVKGEKRLTLKKNPHFYTYLPTSPEAYGGGFKIDPTEDFRHAERFYVLTDEPSLISVKTDQSSRCFGNAWCPNGAVIFKNLSGRLEGETIVKESLRSTQWRFCMQPPVYPAPSQSARALANHRRRRPIVTLDCPCENWKPQIDSFPSPDVINLRVCAGRALLHNHLLTPLPPTSERPQYSVAYRTYIHMLDYDSLLNVFHHYRLEDIDNWNRRFTWYKLAHVCRKWRYLVYDSSSLLDMYLLLTNGSPSIDSLAHLPPLPLAIDYRDNSTTRVRQDEVYMLTGLKEHGRVRRAVVQSPSPSLHIILESMNKPFQILEDLSLLSTTEEETSPVLPATFRAPNLRHLAFQGIGLPTELSLLPSATNLITLTLTRIPAACYIPPGHLITQLQGLPHLEELSIGFVIPIPRPSAERELLPAPIPRITLPTLKRLIFRGVCAYLENLVAQISAPLLERLSPTLFFEVAYSLANLTQFIHATEALHCCSAKVLFNSDGASIVTSIDESQDGGGLRLNVSCEPLDWKIDSAAQVCRGLEQVLVAVEELTLDLDEDGIPSDPAHAPDSALWHELLLPFGGVKKLHIGSALTFELSDALKPDAAGLVLDLLPELQDLEVQLEINDAYNSFSTFIETRERAGRRIRILVPLPARLMESSAYPPTPKFDKLSFVKYMKIFGRAYRKQATELIYTCQTFVRTQEETPDSCAKLKSALELVDDALESATKGEKKISKVVDEKFEKAINALILYEMECHRKDSASDGRPASTFRERMEAAKAKDKTSSNTLNALKEKLRMKPTPDGWPEPTRVVNFILLKSLVDEAPIVVQQVLRKSSNVAEILWNFNRFKGEKRITLKQNPHFYKGLPRTKEAYGGNFRSDPIENFLDTHEIYVLTDRPGRVYLDSGQDARAFGNVWLPNNALIFKDVCGKLEGESIVGASIQGNLKVRYRVEPLQPSTSTNAAPWEALQDWREPIRRTLNSKNTSIRISVE